MRRLITIIATLAIVLAACGESQVEDPGTTDPSAPPGVFAAALETFGSCDELRDYYVTHALDLVGPYGLGGGYGPIYYEEAMDDGAPVTMAADTAEAGGSDGASRSFTGTNVQVLGVDEVDIWKTDGERIFAIVDGTLRTAVVGDAGAELAGSLELGWWPTGMLLEGDTLLLIGSGGYTTGVGVAADESIAPPQFSTPTLRIVQMDVSDPANPRTVRTLQADGSFADARISDGVVRVAVNSSPVGLPWEYPQGSGIRAERDAEEANRRIVRESTLDNWLPYYVLTDADGTEREGRLLDCTTVMAPSAFSGLSTLSILTFDLADGIDSWASAGVVASGTTMYATADHTYLATQRWVDWSVMAADVARETADGFHTQIHLFDTSAPTSPRYVASGEVPGFLLSQFSMDEFEGDLRVASTSSPDGWGWSDESESQVTVLRPSGGELSEVGSVGGLGETERIYAVRFMDEVGYVVTFRQTDPLYVIDLSDPEDPQRAGELKIPGYSAYLHPVADGRLLGIGQDADDDGRTEGVQASLFDVSDPDNPDRLDTVTLDGGWSQVEGTHHAFTLWNDLAFVPFERWDWIERSEGEGTETFDTGILAIRIGDRELTLVSTLRPVLDEPLTDKDLWRSDPWRTVPMRTSVIDGTVFTLTNGGIAVHDGTTFERIAFLEF